MYFMSFLLDVLQSTTGLSIIRHKILFSDGRSVLYHFPNELGGVEYHCNIVTGSFV